MQAQPPSVTTLTDSELVETAFRAQGTLSRAIHALNAPEWQTIDLTMPQMKALLIIDTDGALSIGELACRMNFAKPAASILVEKLVQGGFLRRAEDPEDRRRAIVQLTDKGADIVTSLLRGTHTRLRSYLARMAHADLVALVQGLSAMSDIILQDVAQNDPCAPVATYATSATTTRERRIK